MHFLYLFNEECLGNVSIVQHTRYGMLLLRNTFWTWRL